MCIKTNHINVHAIQQNSSVHQVRIVVAYVLVSISFFTEGDPLPLPQTATTASTQRCSLHTLVFMLLQIHGHAG